MVVILSQRTNTQAIGSLLQRIWTDVEFFKNQEAYLLKVRSWRTCSYRRVAGSYMLDWDSNHCPVFIKPNLFSATLIYPEFDEKLSNSLHASWLFNEHAVLSASIILSISSIPKNAIAFAKKISPQCGYFFSR